MTKEIIVKGTVQGVFFRKHTKKEAEKLSVTGTVENEPNGDVRILATGSEDQLKALEDWCESGSPAATVETVTSTVIDDRSFNKFSIKH